jgi:hypothetical protein
MNTQIEMNTDGSLNYTGSGSGAVTMNTLTDASSIRSRILAGLSTSGDVDRAVPVAKGGTTQTNANKFLNSDLGISLSGTTITLSKAGDTDSTGSVPSTLKNATIAIDGTTGVISGIGTADIKVNNAKQLYTDITDAKPPTDATKGAVFGTNMYDTNGSTNLTAAVVKNSSITLNAAGYLNNIGTTEKVKNALVEINTDGSLNYAGSGSGSVSKAGLSLDYDDGATVGAIAGTNLKAANGTTTLGDSDIVTSSGTANNTSNVGNKTVAQAQSRLGYLSDNGELSGSLAAAQFPLAGVITAANTTAGKLAARTALAANFEASDGPTVHADNYTDTQYTFVYGDITVVEGGAAAVFTSYDNGSNYIASNQTGKISITHPTNGTYTVDYAWADLDGDNLDGFTLSNATSGSTWSASSFVAGTSESITVTHAESDPDKTIVMSAVTIKHNYGSGGGGGGGCFLPGTPVDLLNGETKAIEEMEIGDKVKGGIVLNKQAYQVDSWYQLGLHYQHSALDLTAGHPVWIEDKGWSCIEPEEYYKECKEFGHRVDVKPEKIEVGDKTTAGEIKFIEKFYNKQEVWNITVDNEHTYYVNGILVHNGGKE